MSRILVAIPCHHRVAIAEQCIPTVAAGLNADDQLWCSMDGETGFSHDSLRKLGATKTLSSPEHIGIEAQRRMHIIEFMACPEYSHLYFTDADALHDPLWRQAALDIHAATDGAPVCLYNTVAHSDEKIRGNTISRENGIIWRRYAPGVSMLWSRRHIEKIMLSIDRMTNFDWQMCDWTGNYMAVSDVSFVDHIGLGGYHHPSDEGLDGGDRASNPTPFLVEKRKQVVAALSK
jgi:hypothetical protein